jgi:hypothetical protein
MTRVHPLAAAWSAAVEVFLREHEREIEGAANDLGRLREWERTQARRPPGAGYTREGKATSGAEDGDRG